MINFVNNVVFIPECPFNAIQHDITAKTVPSDCMRLYQIESAGDASVPAATPGQLHPAPHPSRKTSKKI